MKFKGSKQIAEITVSLKKPSFSGASGNETTQPEEAMDAAGNVLAGFVNRAADLEPVWKYVQTGAVGSAILVCRHHFQSHFIRRIWLGQMEGRA